MRHPEDVVRKYRSIMELARQGAPGERDNAQRIAAKMRAKYPEIDVDAAEMDNAERTPDPSTYASNGNFGGGQVNWADKAKSWWDESGSDWFAFAADVAQQGFGAAINTITVNALIQNNLQVKSRTTDEFTYVTSKIDNDALSYLRTLGTPQSKQEFAHEVGRYVALQVLGELQ
jgi:hypothetical protein